MVPPPGFEPGSRALSADRCSKGPHTWPGYTTAAHSSFIWVKVLKLADIKASKTEVTLEEKSIV